MEQGGHVYILGSNTGTLYIGVTSGLYTRINPPAPLNIPSF